MDKFINPALCVSLIALSFTAVVIYHHTHTSTYEAKVQRVLQACDAERMSFSLTTKAACGSAQRETNSEYLCNSVVSTCWVEVK